MPSWLIEFASQHPTDLWIIAIGTMTNVACGILGCYLVLRRISLLGDALSHAVLPGLVLAFIVTGSVEIGYMFIGAFCIGLLTTFLIQLLQRLGNVSGDAAMGVVFTSLFALGVVLLRRYTHGGVDLDAECVLHGQLAWVTQYRVEFLGLSIPRAALSAGTVLLVNVAFVTILWKELKLCSFDPALATTMGFSAGFLHYLLMALVAATAVGAFEAVGSILVIAMLIVPGATAHLLTDRLAKMQWIAAGVGIASAVGGWGATKLMPNADPAGLMAVMAGLCFLTAFIFSPRYGVLSIQIRNRQVAARILRENLLAMLYRVEEITPSRQMTPQQATAALGGGRRTWQTVRSAQRAGLIAREIDGLQLTDSGRREAQRLVRSHRLWEAYLVKHLGLPLDHVHDPAERMEHFIDENLQEQLVADLQHATVDPHGREIPAKPEGTSTP